MVAPPRFVNSADAEAYNKALQRLTCDYCGYNYFSRRRLNEPVEVYSSQRKIKRWVVVCKMCAVMIYLHERKEGPRRTETAKYLFWDDPTLYRGEEPTLLSEYENKEEEEEEDLPRSQKEDHEV